MYACGMVKKLIKFQAFSEPAILYNRAVYFWSQVKKETSPSLNTCLKPFPPESLHT